MNALILVILVGSGEADSAASQSMLRATSDALGLNAQVTIHEIDPNANDDEVIAAGKKWHADAVARVRWEDGHRHASLHLHGEASGRWIDREIGFNASDAEDERGRTLGFAVISMLPEGQVPRAPPPPPPSKTPVKQGDSQSPPIYDEERDREPPEPPPKRWHGAVDASGIVAAGIGGDATGVGGAARGQWFFLPDFSLRAGGGARGGSVSALAATSFTWFFAGGLSWHPSTPSRRHPFGLGGSLDLVGMHYGLSRTGTGGAQESQGRWIPAADLTLEGTWFFTEPVGIVVAVGGEMTFGQTQVYLQNQPVETIPSLRAVAEAGLRARF